MKRRDFLHSLAVAPAVAVPALQQPLPTPAPVPTPPNTPQAPAPAMPPAPAAVPAIETTPADAAAVTVTRFFTPPQFAALRRLSEILAPPLEGMPGALDAGAPEFLDFLIGASPDDRKALYQNGLDALQGQSTRQFGKPYASLSVEQAESLLASLRVPWTFTPPTDPVAAFLRAAKQDVIAATQNSTAASDAARASGGRGGGVGQYWYVVE